MGNNNFPPTWSTKARQDKWLPPARPEWVAKANAEGAHLDLRSVVPLDEQSLLDTAIANTGLNDFGEDNWREPFQILIKSFDEESKLTLMGRLMTRSDLILMLEARLQIEATYRQHPDIEDEEIIKPLIIIGQARTGTSVLQNILSADPANGTVRTWEGMFPCPPPETATYRMDPRIARADRLVTMLNRVTPEFAGMHEVSGIVPHENILIHTLSFRSPGWFNAFMGQVPEYCAYMATQDPTITYQYEKRVLKLLQWRNPRRTWIMKSPYSLLHLPNILQVYPDAGFVWTHRDPVRAMASVVNLLGTMFFIRSDEPFIGDSLAQFTQTDLAAAMISQPIRWLENGQLPRERLCNIQYDDFVRDPMAIVRHIYAHFDMELTPKGDKAMQQYMDDNPRSSRPAHEYALGSKEEIGLERKAFAEYQNYFKVPNEIFK